LIIYTIFNRKRVNAAAPEKGAEWYQKATNQGFTTAECNLAWMYSEGKGVPKNLARAVELYQKSADQGYANAQCNLGFMYEKGMGVAQNYSTARRLYERSAAQGYPNAVNLLKQLGDRGK
jgi:uncharacterized protein